MTSSLSGESSSLKAGYLFFGTPVSASGISTPIFDIKATEDTTNIARPMLYLSGKKSYNLVICLKVPHQKSAVVGYLLIKAQSDQEVLSLDDQEGEFNLRHFPKSRQSMLVLSY